MGNSNSALHGQVSTVAFDRRHGPFKRVLERLEALRRTCSSFVGQCWHLSVCAAGLKLSTQCDELRLVRREVAPFLSDVFKRSTHGVGLDVRQGFAPFGLDSVHRCRAPQVGPLAAEGAQEFCKKPVDDVRGRGVPIRR